MPTPIIPQPERDSHSPAGGATSAHAQRSPLHRVLDALRIRGRVRRSGENWLARCPAPGHGRGRGDRNPSLSVGEGPDGRVLLRCHAGCPVQAIVEALGLTLADLFPRPEPPGPNSKPRRGLTVRGLAEAKRLPKEVAARYLRDVPGGVQIVYRGEDGAELPVVRIRRRLTGQARFAWAPGSHPTVFGQDLLPQARRLGWVIVCEGETDVMALAAASLPGLGIPGAAAEEALAPPHVRGLGALYIVSEPDAAGQAFPARVARRLRTLGWSGRVLALDPAPHKDLADAWVALGGDPERFRAWLKEAMGRAVPVEPAEPVQEQAAEEHRRKGAAALLVELAEGAGVELFHDPGGDAWASVRCDSHVETYPLRSRAFRNWLAGHFYRREGRPPGSQPLADALDVLESKARFDGPCEAVYVRVAERDGRIFLDLGDPTWRVVDISTDGWQVTPTAPVRCWRPQGLLPLPEPARGGSLAELRPFVNGEETAFVLTVAWLLGALHPHGPYPILLLTGEQGSGKSTLARMLRGLVDPSEAALRRPPRDERDVFVAASNSWVVGFDNLSAISGWLSDALCVMSTGGAFSSRRLYTDREETLLAAKRPVIITTIGDVLAEPDLRDRVLRVELQRLDEASVVDEATLAHRFEEARPRILGALLDAAAAALRYWDQVRLNRTPRMADFTRWVVAAELGGALPWAPGTFLSAYLEHRAALAAGILDDPVAAAVVRLLESGPWSGTATELLSELESSADERATRQRSWPQTPEGLAIRLRRLAPELRRAAGVDVSFAREPGTGRRIIALEGTGGNPSHPSPLSLGSESPCAARVPGLRDVTAPVTAPVNLSPYLSHHGGAESLESQGFAARGDSPDRCDSDLPPSSGRHEEGEEDTWIL